MIQLSLFPKRGYGLVGVAGIVHDWVTGEPLLVRTRRAAARQTKHLAWGSPRVVRLERHEAVDGANGKPTYVVSELQV